MRTTITALAALAAAPALAHPGHSLAPATEGQLAHLLASPDHLALLVGVPLLVAVATFALLRRKTGGDDV